MKISEILREWYEKNARDLPWRNTKDPYHIWISEVILQQTRVNQGVDYYLRFIERFPNLDSLANAKEVDVLKVWQGLGYYSRARNLMIAARQVINDFNGKIPESFIELKQLKGVGDYTAAAIASIAFNEPVASVDGNVSRVVSRLLGMGLPVNSPEGIRIIQREANDILDKAAPGISNQALMDFGALVCRPVHPDCDICPMKEICRSFIEGKTDQIPVKISKTKVRDRWFYYFIMKWNRTIQIEKRDSQDIWKSLFQFPMLESDRPLEDAEALTKFLKSNKSTLPMFTITRISPSLTHHLTHQRIQARFFHIELAESLTSTTNVWMSVKLDQLDRYPVPRLIERYLEEII